MAVHDYTNIKKDVSNDIKTQILQGFKEGAKAATKQIAKEKFVISGEMVTIDESEIEAAVKEHLENAFKNIKTSKKVGNINIFELLELNDKELRNYLSKLFDETMDGETISKTMATKLVTAFVVAQDRAQKQIQNKKNLLSQSMTSLSRQKIEKMPIFDVSDLFDEGDIRALLEETSVSFDELASKTIDIINKAGSKANTIIANIVDNPKAIVNRITENIDKELDAYYDGVSEIENIDPKKNIEAIQKIKSGLLDANGALELVVGSSEKISEIELFRQNALTRLNAYKKTIVELNQELRKTASYQQEASGEIEETAFLMKDGKRVGPLFSSKSKNGHVGVKSSDIKEYDADTLGHSHIFDKNIDYLRFSGQDIETYLNNQLKHAILMCGDEFLEMDFGNISDKDLPKLKEEIISAYTAIYASLGAELEETSKGGLRLVNQKELSPEIQNKASELMNSALYEILNKYGGDLSSSKVVNGKLQDNQDRIIPITSEDLQIIREYQKALSDPKPLETIKSLKQEQESFNNKALEDIYEQRDALDENLQKQKAIIKETQNIKQDVSNVQEEKQLEQIKEQNEELAKQKETIDKINQDEFKGSETIEELNKLTQAKKDNIIQEESLAQKTLEASSALKIEGEAAKEAAKNIENLGISKQSVIKKNINNNIFEETPQQIKKAIKPLDEFQQKILGIKELSEEYDLFSPEDMDLETLEKFQNTLFALNETDLKKLGFTNIEPILADLQTMSERFLDLKYKFENNDFTDEGWVNTDTVNDVFDSTVKLEEVFSQVHEVTDTVRVSMDNLMDFVSKYADTIQKENVININTEDLKSVKENLNIVTDEIKETKQSFENTQDVISDTSSETINLADIIKETLSEEKVKHDEVTESINKTNEAIEEEKNKSTEAGKTIKKTYSEAVEEIKKLQENIDNFRLYDVGYTHYLNKKKEYSELTDDELLTKYQEKTTDKTRYNKELTVDNLKKKWGGILALIEEIQKRTGELKDIQIFNTSGRINEIERYYKPLKEYISSDNIFKNSNVEELQNQFREATRYLNLLRSKLPEFLEETGTDLEKAEYHLKEILNSFSGKRSDDIIDLVKTLNQISKLRGKNVSPEDYEYLVDIDNNKRFKSASKKFNEFINKDFTKQTDEEAIKALISKNKNKEKITPYTAAALARMLKDNNLNIESFTDNENIILAANKALEKLNKTKEDSINITKEQIQQEDKQASVQTEVEGKIDSEISAQKEIQSALKETQQTQEQMLSSNADQKENVQINNALAEAAEKASKNINFEGESALVASENINKLTQSKNKNIQQEKKLADASIKAADAIKKEGDEAKTSADKIQNLSVVKPSNNQSKNTSNTTVNNSYNKKSSGNKNSQSNKIDKITEAYKGLIKTEKEYQILENKKQQGRYFSDQEAGRYQELITIREKYNNVVQQQTAYTIKQMNAYEEYNQTLKETASYIKGINENDTFISKVQKDINRLRGQSDKSDAYKERLEEIQNLLNHMVTPEGQANVDKLKNDINELLTDLKQNGNQFRYITDLQKAKLDNKMADWLERNTRASVETRNAIKQLRIELDGIKDVKSLRDITTQFLKLTAATKDANKSGSSFIKKVLSRIRSENARFLAQYFSVQDWIRYIRQISQTVVELDTAITELRKVSDATDERLALSFDKSAQTAKELGDSITNVINVTADWSRLGYSVDDAEELARVTTLFKNVGDNMSADDASSYMISTLQGFQLTAEKSESIVDKFNEVANNYAIDTRGIGEALQRSAASFNAANTSLSGAIAVVTTANSVVQNPEQVGTAMKTLSARIRGSKVELEELGEEEENVTELTSKLRNEVKAMTGFDIMENEDTYKSIDEIIIGIGEHWKELTDIQQAALAEDLAGKRNSNVLIALLQNADQVKKVYETAEGSAGSAQREQENYMKSIQYSLDKFKATWQEIQSTLFGSDSIKSIVESAATALNGLGKTAETVAPIISKLMEALGGLFEIVGKLSESTKGLSTIGITGAVLFGLKNRKGTEDFESIIEKKFKDDVLKEDNTGKKGIIGSFFAQLKKEWDDLDQDFAKEATKDLTDKLSNSVQNATTYQISDAIANQLGDAVEEATENISEKIVPIDLDAVANVDLEGVEEFDEALNHSSELTQALNEQREASIAINEANAASEAELVAGETASAGATELNTVTSESNTVAKVENAGANVADGASEGTLAAATGAETISEEANTVATHKNTLAKIANMAAKHPLITATVALTAVTIAAVVAYNKYTHRLDNAIKKDKELLDTKKQALESTQKEIEATNKQIESLKELVEQYQNAIEGSQEYYDIVNKIAETDPSLVLGYDENGNAILATTEKINDQIEALQELKREQIQQKRFEAVDVIDVSSKTINDYKKKKDSVDSELKNIKESLESERENLKEIEEELGDEKGGDERYIIARDKVNDLQKTYNSLLEESKEAGQGLKEAKQEWSNNLAYLFDDIPSTLSDKEKEYEKSIRQFAINIASSTKESMNSADFLDLYNGLKNEKNKNILSQLFNLDPNLSREEYKQEAEKIYQQLIQDLAESDFELSEDNQLALRVVLKIDEESEKNYINNMNRFAQSLGVTGVQSREAQYWYSKLSADDIKLVENNIDKISDSVKFISADKFVSSLDAALKDLKDINKEVDELKDFTLQDLTNNVTSKLSSIESLYNTFNSDIINGKKTRLDIDDVEGLRSSLVASDENPLGVTTEQFEEFERIVADGTHSVEEMQDAFDKLSTEFVDATLAINGYTDANKDLIKAQLEDAGYTKESVDAYVEYKSALLGIQEVANNIDFDFNSKNGVEEINKLADAANDSSLAIQQYAAEILLAANYKDEAFDSSASIANLKALKTVCGETAPVIDLLIQLMNTYQRLQDAISSGQTQMISGLQAEADRLTAEIQKAITVEVEPVQLDTVATNVEDAGKEAGDAYVEAFEKELQGLDDLRDVGLLSEKEYLEKLQVLYVKYFANRKEYLKEFKRYEKQYLEGMKSLYESAISAAITILNDEKEGIEKAKDDAIEALEDAKDAEIDPINDHIKALEDEKDSLEKEREAMQKANEEREREINLQKAQYELERANSQRTRLIYKNGQMQYVQDYQEVRNAKKNLEDAIFEKNIAKLDNQIDSIDNQIENLNKQLDDIEEKYDKLIEDTEKFYDAQVKGVQDLIDMWEKLQHQAELVDAYEALNNFGITANDILSGNVDVFNQIRDGYIGTFAGLTADTDAVAQAFGTTTDNAIALKEALLGYSSTNVPISELVNNINDIGNATKDAADKVGTEDSDGTLAGNLNKAAETTTKLSETINGDENSLTNAINEFGKTSEEVVSNAILLFDSLEKKIANCVEFASDIPETLKDAIDVVLEHNGKSKIVDGGAGFTGTAYANGNWSASSKGLSGTALTGELGQEIVVDSKTGKWHTVGDNGAEFANIKPNDIVFNHKQTEELLKNGHINSRGKAYASGNANKFTTLSPEELSKYNKLDFTKDLAEKLDFGNQKLMNIDKAVSTITSNKTVNNNPIININNPTFTCTGVTGEEVLHQIEQSFAGLFTNAYQTSMKR